MSGADTHVSSVGLETFRDALLADRDAIVARIVEAVRAQIPSYRDVSDETLKAGMGTEVELILNVMPAGANAVSNEELARLSAVGEARARDGVAIDEMLLAWRQGVRVVLDHTRGLAWRLNIGAEDVLGFVEALLAWSDRAMAIAAAGHRGAELELARTQQETRGQLVRELLLGTLAPADARADAEAHGFDAGRDYVAVRAALDGDARGAVERALGFHDTTRPRRGLCAVIDGDLAGLLRDPPTCTVEQAVGVGPALPLERLPESFAAATRALDTARAFGLAGLHGLETLGLLPAVVADKAVGETLRTRYLGPLDAPFGAEIITSLRTYFDCEMHVERTAERLLVHSNTLRYRLGRFEELTGANLRDPATAAEVWWALKAAAIES